VLITRRFLVRVSQLLLSTDGFISELSECCQAHTCWMRSNQLQPNPDRTELLQCTSCRRQHQLPTRLLLIDGYSVDPATSVQNLGILIDCDLSMRTHVTRTVLRCFAALRQLRQIRHSVPAAIFQTLVITLVHSRLGYGNAVLAGFSAYLQRHLQCSTQLLG